VSSFIIKGDCDDVLAKLKTTLKAQDAKFDANLQSQFKAPATPPRQFKPAPAPLPPRQFKPAPLPPRQPGAAVAAPAGKPASSTGSATGSLLSSSRNADDSVRGRLHTSQRSTQPR
jgi:hypothetical protein